MDIPEVEQLDRSLVLSRQVHRIASRGKMDDADVQIIHDAADEIVRLVQVVKTYSAQYER